MGMPTMTLQFLNPTGVVSATDDIPVWVRFTTDESIDFDFNEPFPFGLPADAIPRTYRNGQPIGAETEFIDGAATYGLTCRASVAGDCMGGLGEVYSWAFPEESDASAFGFSETPGQLKLQPGAHDYFAGTFKPKGNVLPGNYSFYSIDFFIQFTVLNTKTGAYRLLAAPLATTCSNDPSCSFTRTVVEVPEPSSLCLFGLGAALMITFCGSRKSISSGSNIMRDAQLPPA